MRPIYRAHISLVIVTLIFGMHYGIAKNIMPGMMQPMQVLLLRIAGGVLLFWVAAPFFIREKVERKDMVLLALCGLFGFALNQAFFYEGLNLTTPVDASVIHVLNPVFVLLFAGMMVQEKITWLKAGGIFLGAAGALILILYGRMFSMGTNSFSGNIMVFLNMVFYAIYLVLIKPLAVKYHTATIMKWVSLFGLIFILPFSIGSISGIQIHAFTVTTWLSLLFIIVLNTFIAYLLINYALKSVTATSVGFYSYMQPVIASVMSITMGFESLTWPKVVAALLIFSGVYLVNRRNNGVIRRETVSEDMTER